MTECVQWETEVGLNKGQLHHYDAMQLKLNVIVFMWLYFSDQVEARIKFWQLLTMAAGDSWGIFDVCMDVEEEDGFIIKVFGTKAPVWWQQQMVNNTAYRGVVSSVSCRVLL